MTSLALLTTRALDPLTDQLMLVEYRVFEALWADEVLQLCETEDIEAVVIMHGVEDPEISELQRKLVTLNLKLGATAKDVVWELSQLFPGRFSVIH